ncbi:unnamed protein product, partial [Staurois parvus]
GVVYPNAELCKEGHSGKVFQRSSKRPSYKNERSKGNGPKLNEGVVKEFDATIKEPMSVTKGFKNISPVKVNEAKRGGLEEFEEHVVI